MYEIDNNEKGVHFRVDFNKALYFGDEAIELGERIILEYFEGYEICNIHGDELESKNINRAKRIFEYFTESDDILLESYLQINYPLDSDTYYD